MRLPFENIYTCVVTFVWGAGGGGREGRYYLRTDINVKSSLARI